MLLTLAAAVGLAGCETVPRGDAGGRIDPYRTTEDDRNSSQASIPALLEFTDKTSAELAQELADLEPIKKADHRLVLEIGDLNNKTRTSTQDFELIQRRLVGALSRSKVITTRMVIVESRRRMNREQVRVNGDAEVVFDNGAGGTARYPAKDTFVLLGDFYEAVRGTRRQYYFEFTLTNLQTRERVYTSNFDLGQN